jgi:hypothetical protein
MRRQILVLAFLLITGVVAETVELVNEEQRASAPVAGPILLSTVESVSIEDSPETILKEMAVPGFGRKHGFNHIVLDGWTCSG